MAKETLTLALEGDVSLVEFAKAINNLNLLLNQLTKEVNKDAEVDWILDFLRQIKDLSDSGSVDESGTFRQ